MNKDSHSGVSPSSAITTCAGLGCFLAGETISVYQFPATLPMLYNNALLIGASYVIALLALIALGHSLGWQADKRSASFAGTISTASLGGTLFAGNSLLAVILFCIARVSACVILVAWGQSLVKENSRSLASKLALSGVFAGFLFALSTYLTTALALSCCATLPLLSVLFFCLEKPGEPCKNEDALAKQQEHNITLRDFIKLPWGLVGPLMMGCLLSSFYAGFTYAPYAMNSTIVWRSAGLIITLLNLSLFCLVRLRKAPFAQGAANGYLVLLLAIMLGGFFIISSNLLHIILPLGIIIAVNECLFALAWIVISLLIANEGLEFTPLFALATLLLGKVWMLCVGIALNNVVRANFSFLMTLATICIIALTAFYCIYLLLQDRFLPSVLSTDADLDSNGDAALVEPTLEQVRHTIIERRCAWLEPFGLTERETQVALSLIDGMGMRAIADDLGCTERTVKFHAGNVYRKIDVSGKQELAVMAKHALRAETAEDEEKD